MHVSRAEDVEVGVTMARPYAKYGKKAQVSWSHLWSSGEEERFSFQFQRRDSVQGLVAFDCAMPISKRLLPVRLHPKIARW